MSDPSAPIAHWSETLEVRASEHVVLVRRAVRERAVALGFDLVRQTKVVTAASELARNTLDHGGGGTCEIEEVALGARRGLRLTFRDRGPGIPDVEQALRDGYTTGRGFGLGLGGARRLTSEFEIESAPGVGTTVVVTSWR